MVKKVNIALFSVAVGFFKIRSGQANYMGVMSEIATSGQLIVPIHDSMKIPIKSSNETTLSKVRRQYL